MVLSLITIEISYVYLLCDLVSTFVTYNSMDSLKDRIGFEKLVNNNTKDDLRTIGNIADI